MKILFIVILGIATFGLMLIGKKEFKHSIIYMLAIGGAVNANFYNASDYPIYFLDLPFGVDSVIFTLFIFCTFVVGYFYSYESSLTLLLSTMAAIVFSAVTQLVAQIASIGLQEEFFRLFLSFMFSVIGSIAAVIIMLNVLTMLRKKKVNAYLILVICMVLATIINSVIYYGLSAILNKGIGDNFISLLIPSIIGKLYGILLSGITLFFLIKQYNKNHSKDEEPKITLVR